MEPRRGASAWWYAVAAVVGLATVVGVVQIASGTGRNTISGLSPQGISYVEDGDIDAVKTLHAGPYALVYRSTTLVRRDLVPKADVQVRGGPIDDIRTLKVRNNPADATVHLAYDYSATTTYPGQVTPPPTSLPGTPTTLPPVGGTGGTTTTDPYATTAPYTNGYANSYSRGEAEVAVFTVRAPGQYRISGRITSTSGEADQPDPQGVMVLYPYRLADQSNAIAHGFVGFFGRIGLALLVGVLGLAATLTTALVTGSSRGKAKRAERFAGAAGGWPQPMPGGWPAPPGFQGPPGPWQPGPWQPGPPQPGPPQPGAWSPPDRRPPPPPAAPFGGPGAAGPPPGPPARPPEAPRWPPPGPPPAS